MDICPANLNSKQLDVHLSKNLKFFMESRMSSFSYNIFDFFGTPTAFGSNGEIAGYAPTGVPGYGEGFTDINGAITIFHYGYHIGTNPIAINADGTVIGLTNVSHFTVGFIYQPSISFTFTSGPGDIPQIFPVAINKNGEIIENSTSGQGIALLNGVEKTTIPTGASGSSLALLSDTGEIVGVATNSVTGTSYTFTYMNGVYHTFNVPVQYSNNSYVAINPSGEIVGNYTDGLGHSHGFADIKGTFNTVDPLGSTATTISGINASGEIVGTYTDASNHIHGFTDVKGVIVTFDMPNSTETHIGAVNDVGMVTGYYTDIDSVQHYFTALPTTPLLIDDRNHGDANHWLKVCAQHGVLANDVDAIANDSLAITEVNGDANAVGAALQGHFGSLTLQSDGSYSYKAGNQKNLPHDSVGVDDFVYTASNGDGGTSTASLNIVVIHNDQKYYGGQANTIINGPNLQHTVLDGGAGGDTVNAGNKGAVLIGGHDDILKGGNGSDIFVFSGQFGANTVKNFDANHDLMQFDRSFYSSVADVQSHTHQVGVDTVIDGLGSNDVTLTGVQLASLHFDTSHMLLV